MPAHPDSARTIGHRIRAVAMACAVFVLAVSAYLIVARVQAERQEANAPLPNAGAQTGACSLWFVGSSTIFRWSTLSADMAPWDAHNRGVNGAIIPQITRWMENEPPGPPPAAIVFYGGENDIDRGATGDQAIAWLKRFLTVKTRRYGALPVIVVSLKPSPARWSERPQQTRFNTALGRLTAMRHDLHFVDIRPSMLVNDRPGPFYIADGIHMNAAGYANWTAQLRPALARILPVDTGRHCGAMDKRR